MILIDLILYIINNVRDVENESYYILVLNLKYGLVLFNIYIYVYFFKVKYNVNVFFEFYYLLFDNIIVICFGVWFMICFILFRFLIIFYL